jgi:hypothetical protein
MKIAIQGHPTRGNEVIQIFESLGGKNVQGLTGIYKTFYYIDDKNKITDDHKRNVPSTYKLYTLEEFEKEFPFKIGDTVINDKGDEGFITGLITMNNKILYSVKYNYNQFGVVSSNLLKLKKKEMNTRNITLTLDKAKEWYNNGGELREIALQAFTEQELNPLPKSWKEYVNRYGVPNLKYIFSSSCPNKYIALWKLEQLRDCYRQGWKPDWNDLVGIKYCIAIESDKLRVRTHGYLNEFLSFQSVEIAREFLKNFESLIKEAEDLI